MRAGLVAERLSRFSTMIRRDYPDYAVRPSSNPAAGRDGQDARTIERMDAIRNMKTMAGSPDAEFRTASRNLAHGFCVSGAHAFADHMKEDTNVQ
jgi:hypothetical protein